MEESWRLLKPVNALNAREASRFVFGELVAFPGFQFGFGFAKEKQFAMFLTTQRPDK